MDLTNFKEKVQILLKLKELLIPQIDGNYIKEWENEAIKYQRISEKIIVELKNISYVERLINAISSQLSYLRINLQKYQNMSEQEKDKFKRLYVLAALGLIAKLKLILFFITYINSVENNNKNLYNSYENDYSSQQKVCEHSYNNKINASINSNNYINNKDIKKNVLFNNLDHYYSQFQNVANNYKDNVFNMMILNNLANYNAQNNSDNFLNGNTSNENDINIYNNNNQYSYINNSVSNNSHVSNNTYNYNGNGDNINNNINNIDNNYSNNISNDINSISSNNISNNNISNNSISNNNISNNNVSNNITNNNVNNNSSSNYNYNYGSDFINNLEDHSMAMMNNYASQENENLQNSCIIKLKKNPFLSHINQNNPTNVAKSPQTINCINNNNNDQMLNYNNNQINNEPHNFIQQNQEQIFKYLSNMHQNMNLSSNEISDLPNCNLNACYQLCNDNIQAKNGLLPHNNGLWY